MHACCRATHVQVRPARLRCVPCIHHRHQTSGPGTDGRTGSPRLDEAALRHRGEAPVRNRPSPPCSPPKPPGTPPPSGSLHTLPSVAGGGGGNGGLGVVEGCRTGEGNMRVGSPGCRRWLEFWEISRLHWLFQVTGEKNCYKVRVRRLSKCPSTLLLGGIPRNGGGGEL